jgi:hypothetical protein
VHQVSLGLALFILGCGDDEPAPDVEPNPVQATDLPKVETMGDAVELLRTIGDADVRQYCCYDFGRLRDDAAISVIVPEDHARELLPTVRSQLGPGFVAYIGTTRWLGDDRPDGVEVVIGPGNSQFDILRLARSDAINFGMETEDLIQKLQEYDEQFGIDIDHAETDTIEFRLLRKPGDVSGFARDVYEFCPDIVDQGVGTVPALEESIRRDNRVYLWWD